MLSPDHWVQSEKVRDYKKLLHKPFPNAVSFSSKAVRNTTSPETFIENISKKRIVSGKEEH